MGAAPASEAKAASERKRPGCDQETSSWAALIGADAGLGEERGCERADELVQLGLELGCLSSERDRAAGG
jgi:hypothetical protein